MRTGILAAGNWIRDHVKTIDAWPAQDGLANIVARTECNGGGPYNLLKDLAKLGAPFPLSGIGLVGDDADGRSILADCRGSGIDTARILTVPGADTSSTDVIVARGTGRRTFFHHRGANALLGPGHFDFARTDARIFYLGYLLLLDGLDAPGAGGVPLSRDVVKGARAEGMMTALDCVSEGGSRFRSTVIPVLPEADVLFANDFEAEQITGVRLRHPGPLDRSAVETAGRRLISQGVRAWAIVHSPEAACACSAAGEILWQPAVRIPNDAISSSAGAGDALAAGVLLGLHEGWPMARSLELGVCAAAGSLLHPTSSDGIPEQGACLALGRAQGFHNLP